MEDRIAISRLKQGDLSGLEFLVNCYQARAVHTAYLILYDRALAEDVVQTAFVKVAERIHQFDQERPFAPWFLRMITNDALKIARKKKYILPLEEPMDEPVAQFAHWLVDPGLRPEQSIEEKEAREMILDAIQRLSPEQRVVVVMRYFLDMSGADMSIEMDRPLSTIKWWLRDARKRLSDLVRPQGGSQ
jgi:RNA polymerase sigma-70 factor (ECF subfamily)